MSRRRLPTEILLILAEAFPQTFFTDPKLVQPLKVDIHHDLVAVLPTGIKPYEAKSFLYWYTGRPGYKRALLHGRGRVDLTGAVVESEIPDFIREQARERFLQLRAARQNAKSANRTGTRPAA